MSANHIENDSTDEFINEDYIYPGMVLKFDYVLLKKIGHGNNATVWLTYKISNKTYVAMKIQDSQCYKDGCREVFIIKKIGEYIKKNPDKNMYCISMLDFFIFAEKDDVKFVCSVYELYAGSIHMLTTRGKYKYGLPINVVKKISKQLLTCLSKLHSEPELKIVHTDIKPENILFKGYTRDHKRVIELFEKSNFQKKYDLLVQKYNLPKSTDGQNSVVTSALTERIENEFMDELEPLCMECVKEISKLEDIDNNDEEFEPDDDDDENGDTYSENDDDGSELSNSDDEEYEIKVFNERNQSIDDTLETLNYDEMHDLDDINASFFEKVLNNREHSTDKQEVVDDAYVLDCQIAVTDFGNSYLFKDRTKNEIQDRRYRAPEVILNLNYGFGCDIWSAACVIFELLTGFTLFEPDDEPINRDLQQLYLMEKYLGPIPLEMKKKSSRRKFLFDKQHQYHVKNVSPFEPYFLKDRLVEQFLFSENEAKEISDFLMCAFAYDPNQRATAEELLKHPWLN